MKPKRVLKDEQLKKDRERPVRSSKKGDKDWWIEFQWKSEKDFNQTSTWIFGPNYNYDDQWHRLEFGSAFSSLKAAKYSLKKKLQDAYNHPEDSIGWRMSNRDRARNWRIRNIKTNEIINYEQ